MQAVILAAGRGTRMGALTSQTPKPMLLIRNRPVLEYILDALPNDVEEVIMVVGYLGAVIQKHFGGDYRGKRILYVEQDELNGTAGALWEAQEFLKGRFLVMNGDDIVRSEDIAACAASSDWAILAQKVDEVGTAGLVIVDDRTCATNILEKEAHSGGPGYANMANLFLLDTRVFSYERVLRPGSATEYGLPQTIVQAAHDIPIHVIESHPIIRLTEPSDIAKAESLIA